MIVSMKLVSKSKYVHRYFDDTQHLLVSKWQKATEFMHDALYKKEMLAAVEAVKKYKPTLFMVYAQDFRYIITPELQTWTSHHIANPIICLGVKKLAYLVPQEYIAGLSVEQTIQEANDCKSNISHELRYFQCEQNALEWLLNEEINTPTHNQTT